MRKDLKDKKFLIINIFDFLLNAIYQMLFKSKFETLIRNLHDSEVNCCAHLWLHEDIVEKM